MKKLLLYLFILIAFVSCSEDDSNNNEQTIVCEGAINQSEILGTWNYTYLRTEGMTESTISGNTTVSETVVTIESSTAVFTFEPDGTFSSTGQVTFRDVRDGVDFGTRVSPLDYDGIYNIQNDQLEMNLPGFDSSGNNPIFTVKRLDATNMCLEYQINETTGDPNGSFYIVDTGMARLGYTR